MENVVIIGAGHAAGQVVASLRQKKYPGGITLLGEEPWYPYQRPPLSKKYLAGDMPAARLYFKPVTFYDDPQINVHVDTRVTAIDRDSHTVSCANGQEFTYDKLVIATGSRPRDLVLPGSDLPGVHYLRTINDVDRIRKDLDQRRRVVIVGAGYIGLEVAAVCAQLGLDVTVVEMAARVMSRVVSPELSAFYQDIHAANGVQLMLSAGLKAFGGKKRIASVTLDNGDVIAADTVVVGIGIVPNIELAQAAGLRVGDGIVVDDHCRTNDPSVYAVGDCTWHPNSVLQTELRLESVHNALEQAKVAAGNICGEDSSYAQVPWFWSDQYDLKLQIAGLSQGYDDVVIRGNQQGKSFSCLYLRDGRLIAVDAVNSPKDFIHAKPLIASRAQIGREKLADSRIALQDLS